MRILVSDSCRISSTWVRSAGDAHPGGQHATQARGGRMVAGPVVPVEIQTLVIVGLEAASSTRSGRKRRKVMFVENVDYKVIIPEKKYRMLRDYKHNWLGKPPRVGKNYSSRTIGFVKFRKKGITLLKGYEWNGDDYIPDSKKSMRASAVHDLWSKAMNMRVYRNRTRNWNRGVLEYARICRKDGLKKPVVIFRAVAMFGYGVMRWLLRRL